MGSAGTGRFSDVHGMANPSSTVGTGNGGDGDSRRSDQCDEPINTSLEDVERCTYYLEYNAPPPNDTLIQLSVESRIAVETAEGKVIGYLPTRYSYLAGCISSGLSFNGKVTSSSTLPLVTVQVYISQGNI